MSSFWLKGLQSKQNVTENDLNKRNSKQGNKKTMEQSTCASNMKLLVLSTKVVKANIKESKLTWNRNNLNFKKSMIEISFPRRKSSYFCESLYLRFLTWLWICLSNKVICHLRLHVKGYYWKGITTKCNIIPGF